MTPGRSDGVTLGRSDGVTLGRSDGVTLGRSDGVTPGRSDGVTPGFAGGLKTPAGAVGFPLTVDLKGGTTGWICCDAGTFPIAACCAGVNFIMDLAGSAVPGMPVLTGWVAPGGALGIRAVSGLTLAGAAKMLGLFRFARARLTLSICRAGGKGLPSVRACGWIFRMAGLPLNTPEGAMTLWNLVMLAVL